MTRGRHHFVRKLGTLGALACALLGASAWLPAAAGAAGSSALTAAGPVQPAPPVLDDLMGRGTGAAALDLPLGLGALPGARETAAFAAGRTAVGVVFLQSDGSKMTSSENWSRQDPLYPGQDRRQLVLAKIQNALDWWNAQSPDGSLELFLPAAGSYGAPRTVMIGYEPIRMNVKLGWAGHHVLSDAAWRWPAMKTLGVGLGAKNDTPYPESLYADRIRRQNSADWAFVLYVVDSLHDKDGMFRNNVIAYTADLFGPYSMLTYDNDGYGFAHFDAVLAHEMGHVFGALDEYRPPTAGYPSTGDLTSGYLGVRNGNADQGGSTHYDCIMRGSQQTLNSFVDGSLCQWTIGQAGLRDSDGDSRPDVVDTSPGFSTRLESTSGTTGAVTLRGAVAERPRHRGRISGGVYFRHDLSIKVPHDVRYRVDGGAWQPVTAADGAFDEPSEGWTLTTEPLTQGHHALELEGTTGGPAGRSRDLWAGPTPVTLEIATDAGFTRKSVAVAAGSPARLYVRSTGAGTSFPIARLAPLKLVRLADGKVMSTLTTGENGLWTGVLRPAHTRTYEVRFAGAGQFLAAEAPAPRVTITVK
jgi:hypothetical protein